MSPKLFYLVIIALLCIISATLFFKQRHEQISFKQVTEQDAELVYNWLQQPHVSKWWPTPAKDVFLKDWFQSLRPKGAFPYLVLVNQKRIGLIQYYRIDPTTSAWLPELPAHTIGIDQFIGDTAYVGKGYGTRLIKEFMSSLPTIEPNVAAVIVDPDPKNLVAIKCYEKVGFKKIGEFTAPWGPALVMMHTIKPT